MGFYGDDAFFEMENANKFDVNVYGECAVKIYAGHVTLSREDWEKYKQRLIPVLQQGDKKHATGNNEDEKGTVQDSAYEGTNYRD